jgi:hypothetical protein
MFGQHIVDVTRRNSDMAETMPKHETDYAYATPRSWKNLRDSLCIAEAINAPLPIRRQLMTGFVGKDAASAFAKYMSDLDLIDIEEAIANPMAFTHDKKRADLTVSLLTSVVSAIEKNYTPDRLENAIVLFCDNVAQQRADLVSTQLRHLARTRGDDKFTPKAAESIRKFGERFPEALKRRKK